MTRAQPRIGIDCRMAGLEHAGIGRYIENLVKELPELHANAVFVLFFYSEKQAASVLGSYSADKQFEIHFVPIRHYSLAEQLQLPKYFNQAKLDLLHVPHFNVPILYAKPFMVTIHDLLWHEQRGSQVTTLSPWVYWIKYAAYRILVALVLRQAKHIITPTNTVAEIVRTFSPHTSSKTSAISEGVSQEYLAAYKPNLKKSSLLIYTGSLYPHKNVRLLIDALVQLPDYTVALVGARSVFQEQIRKYVADKGLSDRVQFLGYLPDNALIELYHSAFAFVFPTLSEGFGLPGIEAMATGLPVLASDIPILRETYKKAALYFDPRDVTSLIKTIHTLEKSDREKITQTAKQIAATYSWKDMAQQTVNCYHQLLESGAHA